MTTRVLVFAGGSALAPRLTLGLSDRGYGIVTDDRPVDAVVFVAGPPQALVRQELVGTSEDDWDGRCEAVLRAALAGAQTAFRRQARRLVFVVPAVTLVGAGGYVPYLTATEGIRALAKSAARQWGRHGLTVNCVTVAAQLVWGDDAPPSPDPPALDRVPDAHVELAGVVAFLLGDDGGAVTGQTLSVDGGVRMLP